MTQPHMGTVTVLFTDLVGSTELRQSLGDDEVERLRRDHFQLLRRALSTGSGREIKSMGDGVMAEFASALDAAACATAMQQAVHNHNQQQDAGRRLHVRIGLDAGEPLREEGDLFGTPVVIASRLCAAASGGQTIVSDLVRGLIGSRGGLRFRPLGALPLKGIAEPVLAHELEWTPQEVIPGAPAGPAGQVPLPTTLSEGERTGFVGRTAELDLLLDHWRATRVGGQRIVTLAGEPGIGKTRLARELARIAYEAGASVLYGRCDEDALIAYQPYADALRELAASRPVPEAVSDLVQGMAPELAGERLQIADGAASFLRSLAAERPLLLVLDDLQWAREQSLALLRRLARAQSPGLMIVGIYREADVTREHPLSLALADVRRERPVGRIVVRGLTAGDVAALVEAWAGQAATPDLAQAVFDHTEGNPFFVEELLRHLSETGALHQEGERLAIDPTAARIAIPEGVKAIISRRLSRLSQECNSVLTVASVIGRQFDVESLQRASDLDEDHLVTALDEAVAARVIEEGHSTGQYEFAHALIHEALYEELTTTRRVHLHGQTLRYADSNGVKLAYEVLGSSGPFMIALGVSNCAAMRARNLTTSRRWEPFTRYCRLILYDRRGVGYSAAPERGYSLLAGVEDVRAVLDALGAERAFVWGATDAGPLAIAFAALYPDRVAGLLLLGTTAKYAASGDYPYGVSATLMASFLETDALDQGRAVEEMARARGSVGAGEFGELARRVSRRVWSKVVAGIGTADTRPQLESLRVPTIIVHDPENNYIPVEAARYLHEHIPNSKLVISEEWGRPLLGEEVYRNIRDFVTGVTRSPP